MSYKSFYQDSITHPEKFWREQAKQIHWFEESKEILSKDEKGLYRWYKGGRLNTAYLALDYHVENGRADQVALYYDSPVTGTEQSFTFRELRDEVARFAGLLRGQGVEKGDTLIIYMPMIPQTVIAMLACARLGAVHSVVFGGFAARELAIRIDDAKPKLLLTASGGLEIKRVVDYMEIVDAALKEAKHQPAACIVYQRAFLRAPLTEGRDYDWENLLTSAKPVDCVSVGALDPLYILYTSGTTGVPKGIVRDNGGHAVAMKFSMQYVYGLTPGETYWAASDVGWVVGHSYIVYGPLIHGCSTILYEGKPIRTPDAGAFWRVIEQYKVSVFFTAPTAFRAIKKEDSKGEWKKKYDISSLRYIFLAGERCDVNTLEWLGKLTGAPIIDHWWQTESGWPMLCNMVGVEELPVKPGSVAKTVCGYDIRILDPFGKETPVNEEGTVLIRLPLPPGCLPTLWNNTERFIEAYLTPFPGYFFSGDGGYKDEDGYLFITGRIDDIINVAGHRLSTATMEEVIADYKAVAECAVIGVYDELKGQIPVGFVVLKGEYENMEEAALEKELVQMVRRRLGPVAAFKKVVKTRRLPKTRSGKILRKIMRAMADGKDFKPPSTIEDMSVLGELEEVMKRV